MVGEKMDKAVRHEQKIKKRKENKMIKKNKV